MVSIDGLKTWFEYEVLVTTLLVVAVALLWAVEQFVGSVEIPALTPQFVVALWDAGR